MTKLCLIVAIAKNGAIGKGGTLPWHLPEDLKHFKATTQGHHCVMGRKTWESLPPGGLPGRKCYVISSTDPGEGATWVPSVDHLLMQLTREGAEKLFIIGGARLFQEYYQLCDELHITDVDLLVEGADTFFVPLLGTSTWLRNSYEPGVSVKGIGYCINHYTKR